MADSGRWLLISTAGAIILLAGLALVGLVGFDEGGDASSPSVGDDIPVVVSGRASTTSGGAMGSVRLAFNRPSGGSVETVTGPDGAYSVTLEEPGDHFVIVKPLPHFGTTDVVGTFVAGENRFDVVVPATEVRIRLSADDDRALATPVQLQLLGPSSPSLIRRGGFAWIHELEATGLVGLGFGEYELLATTPAGFTSEAPARFALSPDAPSVDVTLALYERSLSLGVENGLGQLLDTARVAALARAVPGSGGVFDLSKVANGEHVQIAADGYLPVCRVVSASSGGTQVAVLEPAGSETIELELVGTRAVKGLLTGLRGSDCPVPISMFGPTRVGDVSGADAGVAVRVEGVPRGTYEFRADELAPAVAVAVPGPAVRYTVPERCSICG